MTATTSDAVAQALAAAAELDARDPLRGFAAEFHHPGTTSKHPQLYFCGHSLGLQPKSACGYMEQELDDWRRLGVRGHHVAARPWIDYHERAAQPLADLAGAHADEVVAMNSLSVNLHLMMVSFFRPDSTRNRILIEASAFPSDRYAIVSQLAFHGLNDSHLIEIAPRTGERTLRTEDIVSCIEREGSRLALALLPGVQYLTGQAFELEMLIDAARRVGARVGLDLAHAIGNIPLRLHEWNVDFAVWCSYKYLNAGPGAIGGCFVHAKHGQDASLPRFAGWWGHDKKTRFGFEPDFHPIAGVQGWQISNPSIFSMAPLLASLEIFGRAGLSALRDKSIALTGMLERLIVEDLADSIEVITPAQTQFRGCQLSLRIRRPAAEARRCFERLERTGLIGDWREPDILRLTPAPLYNSYSDVYAAGRVLAEALRELKEDVVRILGAGPTGALLAIFLHKQGFSNIELYEAREDPRTQPLESGRSINLALADRGIHALRMAGVLDDLQVALLPMKGRMIHALDETTTFQPYGQRPNEQNYSISRHRLNQALIHIASRLDGVRIYFRHRFESANFDRAHATLLDLAGGRRFTVPMQPLIATDGAGSPMRRALQAAHLIDAKETDLEHGYKELSIPADTLGGYRMAPDALHIWPRGNALLIALPNEDGSFTATLFWPSREHRVSSP